MEREHFWPTGRGEHEPTYALELGTGVARKCPPGVDRDAWKRQYPLRTWLTGSPDWETSEGGIDDLKTGRYPPSPEGNRQLLSYALFSWALAGRPLDWEVAVSITHWPRYPLNILPWRAVALVSGLDLAEHLEDLRDAAANPYTLVPSAQSCTYCPSRAHCKASE